MQLPFVTNIILEEDTIYLYWALESCHESMFAIRLSVKARWIGMRDLSMKARGMRVRDDEPRDGRREVGVSQCGMTN
jgi:hypothetical protein